MKQFVLRWWDGDGCTYNFEVIQPFITDDIDSWEYNFLEQMKVAKENDNFDWSYCGIKLPVTSPEFGYEILPLDIWFTKNLIK